MKENIAENWNDATQSPWADAGKQGPHKNGTPVYKWQVWDKVTRKHGDLQEIAYETFGLASPRWGGKTAAGYKQSQWLDGSLGAYGVRSDD